MLDIMTIWTYNVNTNVQLDVKEGKYMEYNDKLYFDESQTDGTTGFTMMIPDHGFLRHQREGLGMTQQQVADAAGILLRQYQRLESGERTMASTSLRIGLSVCDALKLDPHRFV